MTIPLRGEPDNIVFQGRRLLERALVVVRFTPVLKISEESGRGIADFQEEVRASYPLVDLEHEAIMRVEIRDEGTLETSQERHPVWRLMDIDKLWRVSLSPRSVALEVNGTGYTNWSDFAKRMSALVTAVGTHFEPSHCQYAGVRYVNAAPIKDDDDPRHECVSELVSITGNGDLELADLLWRFAADEGHVMLRSGVMSAGLTYDPQVFEPRDSRSWYLDIDVASSETFEFDVARIHDNIYAQVRRLHAIYIWSVRGEGQRLI
jgi:uncharacterized protein (TIGR04255 family)